MNEPPKKFPNYEDLLALPEGTRAEIINGQIETSTRNVCDGSIH